MDEELIPFDYELYKQGNHEAVFKYTDQYVISIHENHMYAPRYLYCHYVIQDTDDDEPDYDFDWFTDKGWINVEGPTESDLFLKLKQQ